MSVKMRYVVLRHNYVRTHTLPFLPRSGLPLLQNVMVVNVVNEYWHVYNMFLTVWKRRKRKYGGII